VSTGGGRSPRWRADGGELYFATGTENRVPAIVAVSVETKGQVLSLGVPRKLFQGPIANSTHSFPILSFAVLGDGTRFLTTQPIDTPGITAASNAITVVMNWQERLQK